MKTTTNDGRTGNRGDGLVSPAPTSISSSLPPPLSPSAIEKAPICVVAYAMSTKTFPATLDVAVEFIRTGCTWGEDIKRIRAAVAAGDKKTAQRLKKTLPGYLFAGIFSWRANDGLIQRSGLIHVDIDHLDEWVASVKDAARRDPHTVVVFLSASATGIKIIYWYDPARPYEEAFRAAEEHVRVVLKLGVDQQCKDAARLCFTSLDRDIYFNPRATPLPLFEPPKSGSEPLRDVPSGRDGERTDASAVQRDRHVTVEQIRELLSFVPSRPDYLDWIKIASAVWAAVPKEEGCRLLREWSPEEEAGEYERKWPDRLRKVGVGTLFFYAKQNGWRPGRSPAHPKKRRSP